MIVCTDFSPCSEVALERAAVIANRDATRVFIVHTYDAVPCASPSVEICRLASETKASLIVLGSHGRTGMLRRLLGSVAEATVRHAPCSVFVVRDPASQAG